MAQEKEEPGRDQRLAYLRRRLDEVEAEARAKDALLADFAHDLRTPLGPIANLIAVLNRRADLPDDIRPILEMMERNLWREVRLIEDLVDVTRIWRGALQLARRPIELDGLLRETLDGMADAFQTAGIGLVTSLDATGILADADPDRLRQLFRILLDYAREVTTSGCDLTVCTADAGDRGLRIAIDDSAAALSPEQLSQLFGPLDQRRDEHLDSLRLDMQIATGIVEAHGGTISAFGGGAGRGTRIEVLLPKIGDRGTATPDR